MTALFLAFLAACDADPAVAPVELAPVLVPLDDVRLLRRMSLDLRGTLPTLAEIEAVRADPTALDALRDSFLDDPRHEERLARLFTELLRTRLDEYQVRYYDYQLPRELECEFESAVGEEPARLMARVAASDRPWSEIVTADWTMANGMLAATWPLASVDGDRNWHETRYEDGRPAAGVLSTNGLWWRYVTSKSNANRSRAAAVSELFLCMDYLARPVSFSTTPSLADEDGTATALQTEDACIACHSAVDPLASALFGFYPSIDYNPEELGHYHAERESVGTDVLGVSPGYFGMPISGLADLGAAVASDSRFYSCTAENMARLMWRREVESADFPTLDALRVALIEGEGGAGTAAETSRFSALLRAITDTPEYRAGGLLDAATETDAARENVARLMTADLLASALYELADFQWMFEGCDQLANDDYGYRVLVGGADGDKVTRAQQLPGLTWALVMKRLGQAVALSVVNRELPAPLRRAAVIRPQDRVLTRVTLASRPGDPEFTAQLQDLHWRLYGVGPAPDALAEEEALWTELHDADGPEAAWMGLLSALLRDPAFVSY